MIGIGYQRFFLHEITLDQIAVSQGLFHLSERSDDMETIIIEC